jgi:hypothetical protein
MELEEQLDMQQAANAASDSLCRSLRRRMQRLAGSLAKAQDALKEREEEAKHSAEKMASLQEVSELTQRLQQSGEPLLRADSLPYTNASSLSSTPTLDLSPLHLHLSSLPYTNNSSSHAQRDSAGQIEALEEAKDEQREEMEDCSIEVA